MMDIMGVEIWKLSIIITLHLAMRRMNDAMNENECNSIPIMEINSKMNEMNVEMVQ
jgi:hypothetical protein